MDLMWFLLLAHLTGDYALQTDRMAADKGRLLAPLTWHVAIYVACVGITLWVYSAATSQFDFLAWNEAGLLAPLFVAHWIQDFIKSRHFSASKQAYYADQVLHLAQLYLIRLILI